MEGWRIYHFGIIEWKRIAFIFFPLFLMKFKVCISTLISVTGDMSCASVESFTKYSLCFTSEIKKYVGFFKSETKRRNEVSESELCS